jgi:pimeloyl-ACP methyl ester carboxylesterase
VIKTIANPASPANQQIIETPVVFFPGTMCDERVFMPCWKELHLQERAFSPLQWADSLEQMLALSRDRLAYYDQTVHLVGFSMGAYIAALTAIERPEKIASLTLIGSYCGELSNEELQQREQILLNIKTGRYKGMTKRRIEYFLHSANSDNQQVINIIKQMDDDLGASVLAAQFNATANRQDLADKLAQCKFPIHMVTGEQDNIAKVKQLQQVQQHIPGCELSVITNAGHMLPLEQPGALAQYLQQKLA